MQRISWKLALRLIAITSAQDFGSMWPSGDDGPAIEWADGYKEWYRDGTLVRSEAS